MSGTGKKPVVDTTVHVLDPSDSETTLLEKDIDEFELEPITSTKSEPVKARKSPTPNKKVVETAIKAPRTKKKVTLKKSKEQILPAPLILPEDEEMFEQYWKTKPVAPSRMYNFGELSQGGVDLVKYVEPFEWKSFFHIKEIVYPLLVQAFYYNAKFYPDRDLLTSNIKDVALVNKEDLKREMFTEEGAKKNAHPSSMLKTEYKLLHNMCQHSFFPRTGSKDKKTNLNVLADASGDRLENTLQTDGNIITSVNATPTTDNEKLATDVAATLQGFNPITAPPNTTMFSPLMTSSQGSLSSFCTSEFIRNILTSDTPELSILIFLALQGLPNDQESRSLREWFTFVVFPQLHIPPPPEIVTPHFDPFPVPENSTVDEETSPATSPAPDGANE
ncbi:hypothetical protein TSUD_364520 [Trifolium subterraneum]|uniref:Uncharacterized protein n=1 Tax=Trifolium subterraneum TaxID=3900 RepID=A0A2Z6MCH9_TRISU|nr:hypothetical protein TSUD_364520 [Trifolium subterraneum]